MNSDSGDQAQLKDSVLGLLGLAQRSGALRMGATAVTRALREERPGVIFLARDAGQDLAGKLRRADQRSVLVGDLFAAEDLADRFGRDKLSVVSVHEAGFVAGLKKCLSHTR